MTNPTDGSTTKTIHETTTYVNSSTSPKSYATMANQQQSPKKDQAIVFNAIEDTKLLDYILAVGTLIGPKNIIFFVKNIQQPHLYLSIK